MGKPIRCSNCHQPHAPDLSSHKFCVPAPLPYADGECRWCIEGHPLRPSTGLLKYHVVDLGQSEFTYRVCSKKEN